MVCRSILEDEREGTLGDICISSRWNQGAGECDGEIWLDRAWPFRAPLRVDHDRAEPAGIAIIMYWTTTTGSLPSAKTETRVQMTVKDMETLFDYGYWANRKLFQTGFHN